MPGYGQPDVFYPSFFEGEWKMTREAIGLSAPQGEDKADPNDLAQAKALSNEKKLEYTVSTLQCISPLFRFSSAQYK